MENLKKLGEKKNKLRTIYPENHENFDMKECIGSGRDKLTSQHYDECATTVLMLRYRYI